MKNNNDDALADYFSSMLNEPTPAAVKVEELPVEPLQSAILPETLRFAEPEVITEQPTTLLAGIATGLQSELDKAEPEATRSWKNIEVEEQFQVLFFELSGMTFAVPLIDLGGIYQLDDSINSLFGKPDWFSGVITHNKTLFNIVDTAKWVSTGASAETLNYSHYIILGATQWGLSCEGLLGTESISKSQVKWRQSAGKRPWIAGMVKEKMCALIHAEELVKLLNAGNNIHGN